MTIVTIDGLASRDLQGFADGARRALAVAEQEARSLGHPHLGTEHLLLGVLSSDAGRAAEALRTAGATAPAVRRKVTEAVGPGDGHASGLALSPRAARAIGRAPRFARDNAAGTVDDGHLLLAVLDVEGTAGQVLRGLGVDLEQIRSELSLSDTITPLEAPDEVVRREPRCPTCHADLRDGVDSHVVLVDGQAAVDEIVIFTCAGCGAALGTHVAHSG